MEPEDLKCIDFEEELKYTEDWHYNNADLVGQPLTELMKLVTEKFCGHVSLLGYTCSRLKGHFGYHMQHLSVDQPMNLTWKWGYQL